MHGEAEEAALAFSIGESDDLTLRLLHYALYDCQSKTDTLVIQICSSHELSKACKKFRKLRLLYSYTCVRYMDNQAFKLFIVACSDNNCTFSSEFFSILYEIYQNLSETSPVTTDSIRQAMIRLQSSSVRLASALHESMCVYSMLEVLC